MDLVEGAGEGAFWKAEAEGVMAEGPGEAVAVPEQDEVEVREGLMGGGGWGWHLREGGEGEAEESQEEGQEWSAGERRAMGRVGRVGGHG